MLFTAGQPTLVIIKNAHDDQPMWVVGKLVLMNIDTVFEPIGDYMQFESTQGFIHMKIDRYGFGFPTEDIMDETTPVHLPTTPKQLKGL